MQPEIYKQTTILKLVDQPADTLPLLAPQALPDGAVLAVDGEQAGAVPAHPLADKLAGHDQDLLGGDRDVLARLERGQGGGQRRRPHGRDYDQVDVRVLDRLGYRARRPVLGLA